jgi:hypothetical protein
MIALNAFAWYMFKLWDPKAEQASAARDLVDDVQAAAMKHLSTPESKSAMIAELAPSLQAAILNEVRSQVWEMAARNAPVVDVYAADTRQLPNPGGIPFPIEQPKTNPRVTDADINLAKSINPLAAPYRACPKCGDIVPLTLSHCAACGTQMPALPNQEKPAQPGSPFPGQGSD